MISRGVEGVAEETISWLCRTHLLGGGGEELW